MFQCGLSMPRGGPGGRTVMVVRGPARPRRPGPSPAARIPGLELPAGTEQCNDPDVICIRVLPPRGRHSPKLRHGPPGPTAESQTPRLGCHRPLCATGPAPSRFPTPSASPRRRVAVRRRHCASAKRDTLQNRLQSASHRFVLKQLHSFSSSVSQSAPGYPRQGGAGKATTARSGPVLPPRSCRAPVSDLHTRSLRER